MRIRPVIPSDAAAIVRMNADVEKQNLFSIAYNQFQNAEKLISELTQFDHMLVLETETEPCEICAAVLLRVNPQIFLRRMATLRIIVDKKWQGKGIGRALMFTALKLADDELMMERVEAEIPTDNVNALKLFKSSGFKVEGIAKDWLQTSSGHYVDAYLMAHCRDAK
ncbi:MAG: GNAT family N-acetyltransferase [Synergistaceae bacterium]|nr:GNAT family N-acetyltransferase [Synergistaceae bacterium]